MNSKNVLILGAGVSGMTAALKLLEVGHTVTVWSREPEGQFPATSLNAYAMWVPVRIDSDPRIERWAFETRSEFEGLAKEEASGIVLRNIFTLKPEAHEPWYKDICAGFRRACADEIPAGYADVHVLENAPIIDPVAYLPWLRRKVEALGASFVCHEVKKLEDCPSEYTVVVNCAGLGARKLASDDGLFPERMQVVTVKNKGLDRVIIDDEGPNKRACIVPHRGYVKLGAVFDGNKESLEVDEAATRDILERCLRIAPELDVDLADVLSVRRALRPERSLIRVEVEPGKLGNGRTLIHNYGHDGMGYLVSYGIAGEIVRYVNAA